MCVVVAGRGIDSDCGWDRIAALLLGVRRMTRRCAPARRVVAIRGSPQVMINDEDPPPTGCSIDSDSIFAFATRKGYWQRGCDLVFFKSGGRAVTVSTWVKGVRGEI